MAKAPVDQAIKQTTESKEIEKAKDFYVNKNIEVEQLIKQVMSGQTSQQQELKSESVESLLKFLTYVVLNKEEQNGKSLLDMLKNDDKLRNQLFGHLQES